MSKPYMYEWQNNDRDKNNRHVEDALAIKLIKEIHYDCSVTANNGTVYKIMFYQTEESDNHHYHITWDCFAIVTLNPPQVVECMTLGDLLRWYKSASCKNDFPLKDVLRLFCKKILGDEGETDEVCISMGKAKLEEKERENQLNLERIARIKQEQQQLEELGRELLLFFAKNLDGKKIGDYSFNYSENIEQKLTPYFSITYDEKIYDLYFFIYKRYFYLGRDEGYKWNVDTYNVCFKERKQDGDYFCVYMEKVEPHRYFETENLRGTYTMAIDVLTIALQHVRHAYCHSSIY